MTYGSYKSPQVCNLFWEIPGVYYLWNESILWGQWPDVVYLPHQGEFCRPWFSWSLVSCESLHHVSPLAVEALPSNSPLHMLPVQRHKFNTKRTEVRILVNICRCSIKKLFYQIEQSIGYKYWSLRIHLGLTWCHVCNIFTKPCKNGHLELNSPFCKLLRRHYNQSFADV